MGAIGKAKETIKEAAEPLVAVFSRTDNKSKKTETAYSGKVASTRLLPNPRISVDDVAALFGKEAAAKLSNKNFQIMTTITDLCYMLFDCKKPGLTPEDDDRLTSDEIHAEMNRLLKEFRRNREPDYTDFQLVEMMLLFSRCFAPLEECWSVFSIEHMMSRVKVDGWDGESFLDGVRVVHDKTQYIYPDTEFLIAFFVLPDVNPCELGTPLLDEFRKNISGKA